MIFAQFTQALRRAPRLAGTPAGAQDFSPSFRRSHREGFEGRDSGWDKGQLDGGEGETFSSIRGKRRSAARRRLDALEPESVRPDSMG